MTDEHRPAAPAGLQAFSLAGRSALITGAGGGVGAAVAAAFAAVGAAVLVTDIDLAAATAVSERIAAAGGTAVPFALDVCDAENAAQATA
ncbi:SDR family NAD(P)-dependent oxidoreductase, partial [Gordonia sp. (in: high G+C Gram-positive bacteria)]